MARYLIKKVHGGYRVDGLDLLRANCGCCCPTGPGGCRVGECCHTYSIVKYENNTVAFFAKATTPYTKDNFEWGYRVKKGPLEVDVLVHDTRSFKNFAFNGNAPPSISEWEGRGWEILELFDRPLEGPRAKLPEWCQSPADACLQLHKALKSPHVDSHQSAL